MKGILYGIGVGPGNPELLTLQAVRLIQKCQVIAVPESGSGVNVALEIAKQAVPQVATKKILYLPMPMTKEQNVLEKAHEAAVQALLVQLEQEDVAFLTLGDVSIYSTFGYLQKKVQNAGGMTKMVPGIPSFCAAAAKLNIPLVEKEETLHIVPVNHESSFALPWSGTKIFMKAGKRYQAFKKQLQQEDHVFLVENCGMQQEKCYQSVEELPEKTGYFSLIMVKDTKKS